jgi:hypothetical protein
VAAAAPRHARAARLRGAALLHARRGAYYVAEYGAMTTSHLPRGPLFVLLLGELAQANMYDVFERHKLFPAKCPGGCAPWTEVAEMRAQHNLTHLRDTGALFAAGLVPADAANLCAMPGMANPTDYTVEDETWTEHAYAGSFCYCKNATANIDSMYTAEYCRSSKGVPEQINLQIASAGTVVVGFVTFETVMPAEPPVALFGKEGATPQLLQGVSHWYMEKSGPKCNYPNTNPCVTDGRNYTMSFVKFANLEAGANYTYKVKSGSPVGQWSDNFTFRAAEPSGGTTRVAVYGDMGVYSYNNMQNLKEDCDTGKIDAIVHMGDHVYFWEDEDNQRGDAYMNAFQPTLSSCPWMPILGNHEYNDADDSWRVVNQTWGEVYGQQSQQRGQENGVGNVAQDEELFTSTDTALGHFMTRHNLYAQGTHGATPSGTSRWYSVDIGQMHLVGLDLGQNGQQVGPSNTTGEMPKFWEEMQAKQIAWLRKDLQAVDRNKTPWVMVMSHYPFYHTALEQNAAMSADWYVSPEAERFAGEHADKFKPCETGNTCTTVRERVQAVQQILDPIFAEFGVEFCKFFAFIAALLCCHTYWPYSAPACR